MSKLLQVDGLKTYFYTRAGVVKAVDGLSFSVEKGKTLAIVGESGSGKSVSMMSLMGLIPQPPGRIVGGTAMFDGVDLLKLSSSEMNNYRGKRISMIFQDPMTSLNPYLRISTQMMEALTEHNGASKKEARDRAIECLGLVGIPHPEKVVDNYPHQFSGGMRQRVMIAMSLMNDPELLIADEPTTALDVTIQAQILELLNELQQKLGMGVILITHDLGVVAGMSDSVVVMYAGKMVEKGSADDIFYRYKHPYTEGLLDSIPRLNAQVDSLYTIPGLPPDPSRLPPGCPFAPRCRHSLGKCQTDVAIPAQQFALEHQSNCHLEELPK